MLSSDENAAIHVIRHKNLRIDPNPIKAIVLSLFTAAFNLDTASFEIVEGIGERLPILETNFSFTPGVG